VERLCEQLVVMHGGSAVRAGRLSELRSATAGRYRVAWQGPGNLPSALAAAGVQSEPTRPGSQQELRAKVPPGWSSRNWFEIAQECGVVLTGLAPEEENLEQLFFRLTQSPN
jgi:ABC-type uncharacterized transport system ATPase subunit